MPIDNAPAQNAQSLLNGIDYSALIGGPLEAAIKAQAMAARSTWEFIKEVGLKDGPDGDKEAVTVSFTYVSNGQMMKLNVPLLIIVPIPLIEVTEVRIDFKASINASSSQSNEESESSQLAAEASAEAKIGWGPFSLSASFKASYSSKKDSKATSDSRYSVEYTQNVSVVAGQADVPAGLATILAILSSNVTGSMPAGSLAVSPGAGGLRRDAPAQQAQFEVHLRDGGGLDVADQDVIIELDDTALAPAFEVSQGVADLPVDFDTGSATLKTDRRGRVLFQMSLDPAHVGLLTKDKNVLHVTAKPGKGDSVQPQTYDVLLSITGVAPGPTLRVTPGTIAVAKQNSVAVPADVLLLDENGDPAANTAVTIAMDAGIAAALEVKNGTSVVPFTGGQATLTTDQNGALGLTFEVVTPTAITTASSRVALSATVAQQTRTANLTINWQ